ncbi:hypothetical protein [Frankia sp. Cr1]|uniref:hypothetical protein n=1 Tax=Frankia sp. Cr1 TaxID=3073931 RepID=UPI002AD53AD1|nr:hypothetical protein [Frankia sp. Cr1]
MNVGIYFDLRNPPGQGRDFSRLYGFTLEMCQEAEHLGVHSVWASEHQGVRRRLSDPAARIPGGRLDLGLGLSIGYRVPEYELFGATLEGRYAKTDGRAPTLPTMIGRV